MICVLFSVATQRKTFLFFNGSTPQTHRKMKHRTKKKCGCRSGPDPAGSGNGHTEWANKGCFGLSAFSEVDRM
ncbi:hypothetical protein HanIR_Chr09g0393141 [Helianthus annuus]|nr:hypothetical protein HanIR_Chr09g0393141 [Helianthus annuus]